MYIDSKNLKYERENQESDMNFVKQGFQVGDFYLILPIKGMNLVARKPKPLGTSHPMNKSGKEYFSNALQFEIYDTNFKKICDIEFIKNEDAILDIPQVSTSYILNFTEEENIKHIFDPSIKEIPVEQ